MTDIQSILIAYLASSPSCDEVALLKDQLQEYITQSERDAAMNDLAWQKQLPESFSLFIGNDQKIRPIREKFRKIYNHLRSKGITVTYSPKESDKATEKWSLQSATDSGFLYWYTKHNKWDLHNLQSLHLTLFRDGKGNLLEEFSDVSLYNTSPNS